MCIKDTDTQIKSIDELLLSTRDIETIEPGNALSAYTQAYDEARAIGYESGMANGLLGMGKTCAYLSEYEKAITHLTSALEIFIRINNTEGHIRTLNTMGIIYSNIRRYDSALQYYTKSLHLARESGSRLMEAKVYNYLGQVYRDLKQYDEALKYFDMSLELSDSGDDSLKSSVLINIGSVNNELGKLDSALEYYNQALPMMKEHGNRIGEAICLHRMGEIYKKYRHSEMALDYYSTSLQLHEETGSKLYQCDALIKLGELFAEHRGYMRALSYFQKALAIAKEINAESRYHDIYIGFASTYEARGKFEEAIECYKMAHHYEKEAVNRQLELKLNTVTAEFRIEQAQKETEIFKLKNIDLKHKNDEIEAKASALEEAMSELKEAQLQLIQTEKLAVVGQLVAGIAHEMNSPLASLKSSIQTASDQLEALDGDRDKLDQYMENVRRLQAISMKSVERIYEIVKNLKDFSKLDQAELQVTDIHRELDSAISLLSHLTDDRIQILRNYGRLPSITCYSKLINQAFLNILTNAVQAIPDKGKITVSTCTGDGSIFITITDTGVGIHPDNMGKIFDPNFSTRDKRVGAGLGLALTYRIIEKHKGKISVESILGEGSRFIIELPEKMSE